VVDASSCSGLVELYLARSNTPRKDSGLTTPDGEDVAAPSDTWRLHQLPKRS
jgi:hypothetical protein